jgi:NADH dehydrogenase
MSGVFTAVDVRRYLIMEHVVIIGGGFGGLSAAQSLKSVPVRLTLLDRRNFHLFQPLLYQVATGWLSPANIASTLRATLRHQKNASVLLAEAKDFAVEKRRVLLDDGEIQYDTLILATGSGTHYFGNERWAVYAPGLKTVEDATEIRRRILKAFEAAERENDPAKRKALLTFAIVGGGPTGVELAGTLGEIAHDTLKNDFRNIDPSTTTILLIEGGERIIPSFDPTLSERAATTLRALGVTVLRNALVTDIGSEFVTVKHENTPERIACHTVIWAAGVKASPHGQLIASKTGAKTDRSGRVEVEPDLTVRGHPEIFVIGDLANYSHQTGKPLPGVAPVAIQQGRYVAQVIAARLKNQTIPPFRYHDHGSMAIVGRGSAVAEMGRFRFSGFLAWLAWLFVHLRNLIEFENKILVLIQWGWYYLSRNRAARLITGDLPSAEEMQHGVTRNRS